jgi:putative DNA modification/repair radical SAM protein
MSKLSVAQKLAILADAAKYDASCASSGAAKRDSLGGRGVGSTTKVGICHAYTPDGRCVSLLKILMTNVCVFDCAYCINRASSNVRRARFTAQEIVALTIDFYKRNYIEGLFLSSGIIQSPNYTMEQLALVAKSLRQDHDFRGYIHLKTIPEADQRLIDEAALYADRLSINIELPDENSLRRFAPEKHHRRIKTSMGRLQLRIDEASSERRQSVKAPRYAPAGQSTQLIVGADAATDIAILRASSALYASYRLRRVYYSAFSPIPDASSALPLAPPPLMREHRLYQADWLLRFYGFTLDEIATGAPDGMFALAADPKLSWALANRGVFPIDVNRAPLEMLLRVPGLGVRAANKIVATRRHHSLRFDDLTRLAASTKKIAPFVTTLDWRPVALTDRAALSQRFAPPPRQPDLFAA